MIPPQSSSRFALFEAAACASERDLKRLFSSSNNAVYVLFRSSETGFPEHLVDVRDHLRTRSTLSALIHSSTE